MLFQTKNLRVDLFNQNDITAEYLSWLNNKKLMKFSNQRHVLHTVSTSREYLERMKAEGNLFLSIQHQNGIKIGTATIYISHHHKSSNISLLIGNSNFQGRGYGTEIWIGMINYCFTTLGIRKISCGTTETNSSMIHIMKKGGMKLEAILKKQEIHENKEVDILYYALFADEYTHNKMV